MLLQKTSSKAVGEIFENVREIKNHWGSPGNGMLGDRFLGADAKGACLQHVWGYFSSLTFFTRQEFCEVFGVQWLYNLLFRLGSFWILNYVDVGQTQMGNGNKSVKIMSLL